MTDKPVLLFDLGGVIVPWVGIEALRQQASVQHGKPVSRDTIIHILAHSEVFNAYETGQCNNATFLKEMLNVFDFGMSLEDLARLWNSWVKPPFPQTIETLTKLKRTYTLACLSNTNALHWAHLNTLFGLHDIFDYCFASHLIKVAKPDPRSYTIPLAHMSVKPSDVIFFDDTQINIEAARNEGLRSYHVDRAVGVVPLLKELTLEKQQ